MFRWASRTQVTPRLGLPQPSVEWASSLLWLRCRRPQSAPVSTAPPPPGYAIWPGYNHRQKGCWLVTEILKQYIYLSGDFFFVFNEGNTRDILWALVACLVISCHKNGPLTFREYDILNVDLLRRKKSHRKRESRWFLRQIFLSFSYSHSS